MTKEEMSKWRKSASLCILLVLILLLKIYILSEQYCYDSQTKTLLIGKVRDGWNSKN